MSVKRIIKKVVYGNKLLEKAYKVFHKHKKAGSCVITNKGYGRYDLDVIGSNNALTIGNDTALHDTRFRIRGNNNRIVIDENCTIGGGCSFWVEGNNSLIHVCRHSTFTQYVHLNAQEDGVSIVVGQDCMFSNNIIVRTSDSHPIYSLVSGERTNPAKSIIIGEHVWIAPNSKIMKGVNIGSGTIVGSDTMVTKDISENVLVVGHPARVVRENIKWTREELF